MVLEYYNPYRFCLRSVRVEQYALANKQIHSDCNTFHLATGIATGDLNVMLTSVCWWRQVPRNLDKSLRKIENHPGKANSGFA